MEVGITPKPVYRFEFSKTRFSQSCHKARSLQAKSSLTPDQESIIHLYVKPLSIWIQIPFRFRHRSLPRVLRRQGKQVVMGAISTQGDAQYEYVVPNELRSCESIGHLPEIGHLDLLGFAPESSFFTEDQTPPTINQ